jgi:hypothetical protein
VVKLFVELKSLLTNKLLNSFSAKRRLKIPPPYNSCEDETFLERVVLGVGVFLLLLAFVNLIIIHHRLESEQKPVEEVIKNEKLDMF